MGEYKCYTPMYRKGSNVLLPPPLLFRPATKSFQNFKIKVLDNVKSEINRVTMYTMKCSYIKRQDGCWDRILCKYVLSCE